MPDISGLEIASTIRSLERSRRCPIIALTADTSLPEPFKEAGIDDYLLKPISVESARYVLDKYIKRAQQAL